MFICICITESLYCTLETNSTVNQLNSPVKFLKRDIQENNQISKKESPQIFMGFPGGFMEKSLPANAGDLRDTGLIPGFGRSPGGDNGNPLHYSCQENPMDREAWWATVHSVAKSWTQLKRLSMHADSHTLYGAV